MQSWVKTVCLVIAALSGAASSSVAAPDGTRNTKADEAKQIQEQRDAEARRFAIGLAITSGLLIQDQDGTVTNFSQIFSAPSSAPPFGIVYPAPLRPHTLGRYNAVSPHVGLSLELMTPTVPLVPLAPRAFLTGEILPTYAGFGTAALEGSATQLIIPESTVPPTVYSAKSIGGTGSRLDAQVMTTVISASAGMAFELELRKRLLRIKPSVGWIRWGVIAQGRVLGAFKDDPVVPTLQPPVWGLNTRTVELYGKNSGFFNAIGPGLEVEMELQRRGQFRPILYLIGAAYRTVGDDTIVFQANTQRYNDVLGEAIYGATWHLQIAPWSYRVGLGFRLRWVGR